MGDNSLGYASTTECYHDVDPPAVAKQEETGVERKTGFLDLPGDIRNLVYEYARSLGQESYGLHSSCRFLRQEYRPLFLQNSTFNFTIFQLRKFLMYNYPVANLEVAAQYTCKIKIYIEGHESNGNDSVDFTRIIAHLQRCPTVSVLFNAIFNADSEYACAADSFQVFFDQIVRASAPWRKDICESKSVMISMRSTPDALWSVRFSIEPKGEKQRHESKDGSDGWMWPLVSDL
ncbi:hypothetical protein NX059_005553 [Plenodomus lindquistii]|nr:hypothetical protein NX059_005553 [Plenodomus lindquistii]